MATAVTHEQNQESGKFFTFFVDGKKFRVDDPAITGAEIMRMAGIPLEVGLLVIEEDGTQRQVDPQESFELKPGRRFKKAPRFKRG